MPTNEVKRRAFSGHLSGAINKLTAHLEEETPDEQKLLALIEQVQIKFKKVVDMADKIQDTMEDDTALEADIAKMDELENTVIEVKVKAKAALEKLKKTDVVKAEGISPVVYYDAPHAVSAKLPDATLQEFDGDEESFPSFIDQFTALVHNNPQLTDIDKFGYLKGVAKVDVIQHYPLTEINYKIALQKLKEEYGDEELIAKKHLNALLDMSKRSKPSDNKELQDFYNFLESKLACLEALCRPVDQKNDMLITLIYRQLPKKLKLKIAQLDSTHSTVKAVMEVIRKHIKTTKQMQYREASDTDSDSDDDIFSDGKIQKKKKKTESERYSEDDVQFPTSSASALPLITQRRRPCPFCRENHSPLYCQNVTDVSKRRDILRRDNRCYNCLASGHRVADCRNEGRCRTCQGRHHTAVCAPRTQGSNFYQQQKGSEGSNFYQQQKGSGEEQKVENRKPLSNNQSLSTSTSWEPIGSVLLEIAQAEVRKPGSQDSVPVNIFFDKGAQLSYCTKQVKERLQLDTVYRDVMETNTFGSTDAKISNSEVVNIQIVKGEFVKEISVHVSDHVCNPLPSFKISSRKMNELRGITLASKTTKYEGTHEISLLIGADLYMQFVEDEIRHTSWGAGAVKTKLGWLLSGPMSEKPTSNTNVYVTTSKVLKSLQLDESVLDRGWINEQSLSSTDKHLDKLETISDHTSNFKVKKDVANTNSNHHNRVSALSVLSVGDSYNYNNNITCHTSEDIKEVDDWFQYKMQTATTDSDVELRWFWEMEHIGIVPEHQEPSIWEEFVTKIRYKEEHKAYEVEFPCKLNMLKTLPDNYHICEVRLQSLLSKLNKPGNEEILNAYEDIIKKQLQEGIIEEVNPDQCTDAATHYLPHHGVIRKDKPSTAVRIVYDGSAKSHKKSLSLNQCLQAGPSLVNNLASVLIRFRMHPIGIVADISRAFLRMFLTEEDRDLTRFLWREGGNLSNPVKVYRFTRVPFGLTCSPFLLHATIIHHLSQHKAKHPELVEKMLESFYVDDMLTGADTEEDAVELANESDSVMKEASMELCKYSTNSSKVLEACSISEEKKSKETMIKVLGMTWNKGSDQFEYHVEGIIDLAERLKPTKRTMLKIVQKVYDPMGFLSPYLIRIKVLLQDLCRLNVGWDELLPDEVMTQWKSWITDLKKLKKFVIPRCVRKQSASSLELVCFCDASKAAYAAVIYLRCVSKNNVTSNNLIAKSRVSPMKQQTIPRLELLGAVLLARLTSLVMQFLSSWSFTRVTYFTDSMNVLCWIQGAKKWNSYISKRLEEINTLTSRQHWQHCEGEENPADYPTRGMTVEQLCNSQEWLHGPSWLLEPTYSQASKPVSHVPTPECLKEELKSVHSHSIQEVTGISRLLKLDDYSNLGKLFRVTAYIYRFVKTHIEKKEVSQLQMKRHAELQWIRNQQIKYHGDLMQYLRGEVTKPPASLPRQLDLFLDDDGIVRCSGRFKYANLSYMRKYPIFLPRQSYLTELIIGDRHRRNKHAGVKTTLAEIREEYWIPRGRRLVQRIINNCVVCRRITAKPFKPPGPPPLPQIRLSEMPPFTNTGVDFAGPLYCRERGRGKKAYKSYISLYTCASTRAIHMELVPDMSSPALKNSMIRFVSTRGIPQCMISDNAKSFKKTAEDLNCQITRSPTHEFIEDNNITWLFYLEKSPWWGGFIERMVGSVKSVLRKTLYRTFLSYDEMTTLLKQLESIVNSRPITQMFDDEVVEPLTPSHLLIGKRSTQLPTSIQYINNDDERNTYRESVREMFLQRWKKEYLSQLQEYHISTQSSKNAEIVPQKGEVVIMMEGSLSPRSGWSYAVVLDTYKGRDGKIRSVEIRKPNGNILRRPPQLLIPLECSYIPK